MNRPEPIATLDRALAEFKSAVESAEAAEAEYRDRNASVLAEMKRLENASWSARQNVSKTETAIRNLGYTVGTGR